MKFLSKLGFLNQKKREERLFSDISGYNEIEAILLKVLQCEEPMHVLLVGPAGIGKTRFLKAIEKMYSDLSYFAIASASTGAGLINHLFENPPRFLLIDEIEDMKQSDQATLLTLLQDGCLVETKVSKTRRLDFTCSVIATCNSVKKLRGPLLSRFAVIELKGYQTMEEFKKVTLDVLKDNELAGYIAERVYESSTNPNVRDCVRLSKLCILSIFFLFSINFLIE
jgi:MoxR-like ATPase